MRAERESWAASSVQSAGFAAASAPVRARPLPTSGQRTPTPRTCAGTATSNQPTTRQHTRTLAHPCGHSRRQPPAPRDGQRTLTLYAPVRARPLPTNPQHGNTPPRWRTRAGTAAANRPHRATVSAHEPCTHLCGHCQRRVFSTMLRKASRSKHASPGTSTKRAGVLMRTPVSGHRSDSRALVTTTSSSSPSLPPPPPPPICAPHTRRTARRETTKLSGGVRQHPREWNARGSSLRRWQTASGPVGRRHARLLRPLACAAKRACLVPDLLAHVRHGSHNQTRRPLPASVPTSGPPTPTSWGSDLLGHARHALVQARRTLPQPPSPPPRPQEWPAHPHPPGSGPAWPRAPRSHAAPLAAASAA